MPRYHIFKRLPEGGEQQDGADPDAAVLAYAQAHDAPAGRYHAIAVGAVKTVEIERSATYRVKPPVTP